MKFKGEKKWNYKIGETLKRNRERERGQLGEGRVTWKRIVGEVNN